MNPNGDDRTDDGSSNDSSRNEENSDTDIANGGRAELYTLLGLHRQATSDELKYSYRNLCRAFHPDKSRNHQLVERLLEIQQAHQVLSDKYLRHHYDKYGFEGLEVAQAVRARMKSEGQRDDEEEEEEEKKERVQQQKDPSVSGGSQSTQLVKKEENLIEDFERRVRQSQYLIDDIHIQRLSRTDSQMRLGICCIGLNPFLRRKPPVYSPSSWAYSEASVQHSMSFACPNQIYSITLAWILGHQRRRKPFASPKMTSPKITTQPRPSPSDLSVPYRAASVWGRTAVSISRPLGQTFMGTVEGSVDNSQAGGKVEASLQKSFSNFSSLMLRHSREVPNPYNRRPSCVLAASTLEWNTPVGNSGNGAIVCRFSELTMISVLWSEAQSRLGSIVARVDISSFDLLFGFQWTSCHLDSPIWRTTKSKLFTKKHQRWKHHADPVLPGFDLPSTRQTRMTIAMNFGIASGVELKTHYTFLLRWLDPFAALRYSIIWKPLAKEMVIAFKIERLGSALEIPILLAWPVADSAGTEAPSASSPVISTREENVTVNLAQLHSCMPSVIAILASGMIWTGVCCVAIFPILVHRLWVDLMEDSVVVCRLMDLTRRLVSIVARCANELICGISPARHEAPTLKDLASNQNSGPNDKERAALEELALKPIAERARAVETSVCGLVIEVAIYGRLADTMVNKLESSDLSATIETLTGVLEKTSQPHSSLSHRYSLGNFHEPCCTLDLIDVTIPLMALVRNSRLTVFGGISKRYLPGFGSLSRDSRNFPKKHPPKLFIRFRYGGHSYKAVFSDFDPVVLP